MTQKTPAELRAEAEEALRGPGRRRIKLMAQLDELDAELLPLIVEARRVEVSLRRIHEITAVSPNTIRAWTK
jgi:hypothetical protein